MSFDLRLGDCLDPVSGLASLPDKSVDVVITDPPYSELVHANLGKERRGDGASDREELTFGHLDDQVATRAAAQISRVARRWIVIFCDEFSLEKWRLKVGCAAEYVRWGGWIKSDAMPQMTGDRPAVGGELLAIGHALRESGRMHWNGGGRPAIYRGPAQDRKVDRIHPTQKPEWLLQALVADFTDPGELILDPFAGSGTTGVAAIRLGRRFLGWERDGKYHAVASRRLAGTKEQCDLFMGVRSKAKQGALL